METTRAALHKTVLRDRTLWFDGDSSFDPKNLLQAMRMVDVKYVDYITDDIVDFNKHVLPSERITTKTSCNPLSLDWKLPKRYLTLDVVEWVVAKHEEVIQGLPHDEIQQRELRLAHELSLYKSLDLFDVLRTIIFVINTLTIADAVWGVGRGSSVSSYVLYVIGVHDVDSFAYELNIDDFLHD